QLPPGSNLATTQQVVSQIEQVCMHDPASKYVTSQVGTQSGGYGGGGATGENYAQITDTLWDKMAPLDRLRKSDEPLRSAKTALVAARILQKLGRIPGATFIVDSGQGGGFGSPIQLGLGGDDHNLLVQTAKKIYDGLAKGAVPGVINPDISSKEGKPELQLKPDRERMSDFNVSLADLGSALRTAYSGNNDAKMRVNGEEYDIRVMLSLKDRNNPSIIPLLPVVFKSGEPITVGDLTKSQIEPAVDKIDRRNRLEEVRVTADILPGTSQGAMQAAVQKWITDQHLIPNGVILKPLGQADFMAREMGNMMAAFGLGFLLVYMLLASLYDNLLYPLIIQLAQPMAFTGALLALALTDIQLDVVGFIGLVCLVGLVGKNAILLVDYANTLRHRGRTRHDALVESGPTRLRPILMTTFALMLGMLPIAFAIGRGSDFRQAIGVVIIGGMSLSTLLTLFVIPCSYTIFDDISTAIGGFFRGGGTTAEEPVLAEPINAPPTGDVVRGGD
ncbi:MAG TPA: efflux RND transporter permease subunit, partial [Fimbriimonadaceae bacterium]|nr:efflux RND transporter permease subunit [Fimbriimonadaceae bacterium]